MDPLQEKHISMDQDPFPNQRIEALQTVSPGCGGGNFIDQCKGLRVVNFTSDESVSVCDHPGSHSEEWNDVSWGGESIEAGTVTEWSFVRDGSLVDILLTVRWDCGKEMQYSYIHTGWQNIRVLDLAATGQCTFAFAWNNLVYMCGACVIMHAA